MVVCVQFVLVDDSYDLLQVLDLSSVQLVYSSSYFKSLSTGGNVSKALVRMSLLYGLILQKLIDHTASASTTEFIMELLS